MKRRVVVGTFIEYDGKVLFLQRSLQEKHGPGLWGLAAGGIAAGESYRQAAIREILEETGFAVREDDLVFVDTFELENPGLTVEFPLFRLHLKQFLPVKLNPKEHIAFGWFSPQEAIKRDDLVIGLDLLLKQVFGVQKYL